MMPIRTSIYVDAYIVTAVVEFFGMEDIYSAPTVNCLLQQQTKERVSDAWCWINVLLLKEHSQVCGVEVLRRKNDSPTLCVNLYLPRF
jgi:hypothetical protein